MKQFFIQILLLIGVNLFAQDVGTVGIYFNDFESIKRGVYILENPYANKYTFFISTSSEDPKFKGGLVVGSAKQKKLYDKITILNEKYKQWSKEVDDLKIKNSTLEFKEKFPLSGYYIKENGEVHLNKFNENLEIIFHNFEINGEIAKLFIIKPQYDKETLKTIKNSPGVSLIFSSEEEVQDFLQILKK